MLGAAALLAPVLPVGLAAGAVPPTRAPAHPFGSHSTRYVAGSLAPAAPVAVVDAQVAAFYDAWKAHFLRPACGAGRYRVHTAPDTRAATVSEAHGYGMLITALMAGHDPEAQRLFDGLYGYYADHPSHLDPALMAWSQDASCHDVRGADSASDGDLDIAYALLLADAQWGSAGGAGSAGRLDYRGAATRLLAAILAHDVGGTSDAVLLGDWAGQSRRHHDTVRTSDLMVGHFKAFAAATGEARWQRIADKSFVLITRLARPDTGLLPDFAVGAGGGDPRPAAPRWFEGAHDGDYGWNACRVPWRLGTDALASGDPRSREVVARLGAWIRRSAHGEPARIMSGYSLAGRPLRGAHPGELGFVAPLAVAAAVGPGDRAWFDALWSRLVAARIEEAGYYGNTLKLLAMLVVSANWWTP